MKKWSVILKQLSFYVVHLLTGQKYVFSAMCWATRGSEADRDMMSSRASRACWPTNPCLRDRDNTGYEFCAVLKYIHYLCVTCVTLFYPAECMHLCVCTYLCVYGMSREKRRKLAAPWSSLVWKNSSSTEGSLTRATQSWFSRRTSSASTTPPVSAGGRRWLKGQVTN